MYHQIFRSVESTSPMPARAGYFAREFRRTFRRRRWPQGPNRNGGGAPHCGSRIPDLAVFLVRDFAKITFSTTGATQTPAGDCRLRSRAGAGTGYGTQATASRYLERKKFLLAPTSTTGRARMFRRTFRRRRLPQGPTRYGVGCSYGIAQKSRKRPE